MSFTQQMDHHEVQKETPSPHRPHSSPSPLQHLLGNKLTCWLYKKMDKKYGYMVLWWISASLWLPCFCSSLNHSNHKAERKLKGNYFIWTWRFQDCGCKNHKQKKTKTYRTRWLETSQSRKVLPNTTQLEAVSTSAHTLVSDISLNVPFVQPSSVLVLQVLWFSHRQAHVEDGWRTNSLYIKA